MDSAPARRQPSTGEYAVRHPTAGAQRRRVARTRTVPISRVPPADRSGLTVDLRRRHVRGGVGHASHRTRQRSRIAVDRDDVLRRRPGRVRVDRRDCRRPIPPTRDHHRGRDGQRARLVGDRGTRTAWRAADLAPGGGRGRSGRRGGVLLPRLQRDPAADSAAGPAARGQRCRRRGASGLPAGGGSGRRRRRRRCDVPSAGRRGGGRVVRRRPGVAHRDPAGHESPCATAAPARAA